mmetsp:Transcript_45880/g.143560  ORF Transcript_45880/g.143560 Transcript_45880/m.143560 type:complete len:132 (-) Transcript_45880:144-539(-)
MENGARGGQNPQVYTHQPAFHSNLSGIGLHMIGVGLVDARLKTVGVWVSGNKVQEETCWVGGDRSLNRGVVYYLENDKVVGILLVNASFLLGRARDVLRFGVQLNQAHAGLKRQMPLAPEEWLEVRWEDGA